MRKPRIVFFLQLGLGMLGAGVVVVSLLVGLSRVSLALPSAAALLESCKSLIPQLTFANLATLAVIGLGVTVIGFTADSAVRRVRASRRVVRGLQTVERRSTASGSTVTIFQSSSAIAFCAGLVRPRLYLSTGALDVLNDDELAAVVAHERHHASRRDPLRLLVAGVISDGLFFVPALRRLADRYGDLAELAADRSAVRAHGDDPAPLASALLAFEQADPAVVGIAPERVDHLLGDRPRWGLPVALSVWAVVVLSGVGGLAVHVQAGPAAAMNLPMLVAQSCMAIIVLLPLAMLAARTVRGGRLLRRLR